MSKRMKFEIALTDIIKGKTKICKKTRNPDIVEKWLTSRNEEHPDRDWFTIEPKRKNKIKK